MGFKPAFHQGQEMQIAVDYLVPQFTTLADDDCRVRGMKFKAHFGWEPGF